MSRGPESALLGGAGWVRIRQLVLVKLVICEEMEVEHEYYNYGQR